MPTTFSGRITLILLVLGLATICIMPPQTMFQPGLTLRQRLNLKPGIDMVGGVSLIYKIKAPETTGPINVGATTLAEQTMEALKKRVDPAGVRNLVWRPIGSDEIEIQMPSAPDSEDAPKKTQDYETAQTELKATNVKQSEVLDAIALPAGIDRDKKLADLSQGDSARLVLFKSLADMSDQLAAAKASAAGAHPTDAELRAAAKVLDEVGQKFDDAKAQIEADNLLPSHLEEILQGIKTDSTKFQPQWDAIKSQYAGFPARATALKDFQEKFAAYDAIRNTLGDAADLKRLLKGSGVLEFHILAYDSTDPEYRAMYDRMQPGGKGPSAQPGDNKYRWVAVDRWQDFDKPGQRAETIEWNDKHYLLEMITPETSMTKSQPWALERAFPTSNDFGERCVGFQFDTNGGHLFSDLSTRWAPKGASRYQLSIVLDGRIISAPYLNGAITGGSGIIEGGEGGYSDSEYQYLINTLNAGSLPAQLEDEPISERRVGPTLGADNLNKGLTACEFGVLVVGVFMVGYYYVAGVVAFSAVLMNLMIVLGAMAALNATFTLPSLAGIILSVGTAVDANVLIFERLREEQHRGLGLRLAMSHSYARAFSAIIDSNMTSLITSAFLYMFGSEEVKGFGLTLIIGIVASLFTALFCTKTVFGLMIDKLGVKHLGSFPLTFPKWDKLLKPNIDWMGLAWIFYSFSAVAITGGLILFGVYTYHGQMLDIEFASGTSVEFDLKKPMSIGDMRTLIAKAGPVALPAPSVVSVGTDQTAYQVVTPNADSAQVKRAVVETLGDYLKSKVPSRFTGVDDKTPAEAIADKIMFPIPADLHQWPASAGAAPTQAADYTGGVAIELNNITPPISGSEIRTRIEADQPKSPGHENIANLTVISPVNDNTPTSSAIVLVGNPAIVYSIDHAGDWQQELVLPAWNLVKGAVNHEATLSSVNSFNPSVAGDARRDAGIALTLSIIVIMAYIWVRFGNLTYGTATVVALLHDTVFTLAALGYAHLFADTALGDLFQIEPFRINLTVVAGILTIMGYSMIDTIVVFDRIRENRGKYGHLSRTVINDAINQTLSRTLLTAGTTTMTVAFMYFMGGAGIHGFTFVLLIGILVGTYSSVAIAAPILLLGSDAERGGGTQPPAAKSPARLTEAMS